MATSYNEYTGDGVNRLYNISFGYIDKTHVVAYVDGVVSTFSWTNDFAVTLDTAPANGAVVLIARETPTYPLLDFTDGDVLDDDALDTIAAQGVYVAQEAVDSLKSTLTTTAAGHFDATGRRVTNVQAPVNGDDAVTKAWAETAMSSQLTQATNAKNAAESAEAGSLASAVSAGADAAAASASAAGANTSDLNAAASAAASAASAIQSSASATSASASAGSAAGSAASAQASATEAATINPSLYAPLAGATFGGRVQIDRHTSGLDPIRFTASGGAYGEWAFNPHIDGYLQVRRNGVGIYRFDNASGGETANSVMTRNNGDNRYVKLADTTEDFLVTYNTARG